MLHILQVKNMSNENYIMNRITYSIVNGRCTNCGHDAAIIELPDGGCEISAYCEYCDEYNLELFLQSKCDGEND